MWVPGSSPGSRTAWSTGCAVWAAGAARTHPHAPAPPPLSHQANDGNGDQQQRTGMANAAQITAAATRAARLAQVRAGLQRASCLLMCGRLGGGLLLRCPALAPL